MSESGIMKRVRLRLSELGIVAMRNNRGMFRTMDGGRIVQAGLDVKGSSDLIGYRSIEITPDMVGRRIAQFVAVEVKTPTGRIHKEQRYFIEAVEHAGGYALVARSPDDIHAW